MLCEMGTLLANCTRLLWTEEEKEEVEEEEEDVEEVVEEEVEGSTAYADICLHACNNQI